MDEPDGELGVEQAEGGAEGGAIPTQMLEDMVVLILRTNTII